MLLCAAGLHFSINLSLMAKHLGAKSQFALILSFQGYLFKQIALERWRQSLAYELIYFHTLIIKMEAPLSQSNKDIKCLHLFPRNLCSHPCLISCHSQERIMGKFQKPPHKTSIFYLVPLYNEFPLLVQHGHALHQYKDSRTRMPLSLMLLL